MLDRGLAMALGEVLLIGGIVEPAELPLRESDRDDDVDIGAVF